MLNKIIIKYISKQNYERVNAESQDRILYALIYVMKMPYFVKTLVRKRHKINFKFNALSGIFNPLILATKLSWFTAVIA